MAIIVMIVMLLYGPCVKKTLQTPNRNSNRDQKHEMIWGLLGLCYMRLQNARSKGPFWGEQLCLPTVCEAEAPDQPHCVVAERRSYRELNPSESPS